MNDWRTIDHNLIGGRSPQKDYEAPSFPVLILFILVIRNSLALNADNLCSPPGKIKDYLNFAIERFRPLFQYYGPEYENVL